MGDVFAKILAIAWFSCEMGEIVSDMSLTIKRVENMTQKYIDTVSGQILEMERVLDSEKGHPQYKVIVEINTSAATERTTIVYEDVNDTIVPYTEQSENLYGQKN